jgi:hypothetical protein
MPDVIGSWEGVVARRQRVEGRQHFRVVLGMANGAGIGGHYRSVTYRSVTAPTPTEPDGRVPAALLAPNVCRPHRQTYAAALPARRRRDTGSRAADNWKRIG